MSVWRNVASQRKSGTGKPLQAAHSVRTTPARAETTSSLGAVPRLEDEGAHPTETRGMKVDNRRGPRTGRLYQMNIRANEKKVQEFDAEATQLGLTRGALFEKCYDAFKAEQGNKRESFLLQALATLEQIARFESKKRGQLVTPETLLKNMLADRMDLLDMPRSK